MPNGDQLRWRLTKLCTKLCTNFSALFPGPPRVPPSWIAVMRAGTLRTATPGHCGYTRYARRHRKHGDAGYEESRIELSKTAKNLQESGPSTLNFSECATNREAAIHRRDSSRQTV